MQDKIKEKYEYAAYALFLFFMLSSFIHQKIYAFFSPYGTLIMFLTLIVITVLFANKEKASVINKDPVTIAALAAFIITPINLILVHSGLGAMLTVFDIVLICVLFIRGLSISGRMKRIISFTGAVFMLLWYPVVRWDYGFNMVGLMFLMLLIFGEILMEYVKNDLGYDYLRYLQLLFFVTSILLAVCYQARSAALSMMVFGAVYLLTPLIINKKAAFNIWVFIFTAGSIIFTLVYSLLGLTGWNIRFLYKDLLSGREAIWEELWQELSKRPLTGIGSSYEMKNFFMFEVHNALFDILVVHGVIIFVLVIYLLIKALNRLYSKDVLFCPDRRTAFAGISALLFASFFENGFITTPYSMVFFVLLLICV